MKSAERSNAAEVKQCCANLYESDFAKLLLGDSFHPGGLALTKRLGEVLGLDRDSCVVDVASGKGTTALFLSEAFGCEVVGVDYSERNVAEATKLAQAKGLDTRVHFRQGDAEALPLDNASADAVICECSFCTFPNKAAAAKEFYRVLAPAGRVGISDLTRQAELPGELDGMSSWLACIGDAKTANEYVALLVTAGFVVNCTENHSDALVEMVNQVRMKLLGTEIMAGLNKLQLSGVDLGAAKEMANSAMAAVKDAQLGYILICATKPERD